MRRQEEFRKSYDALQSVESENPYKHSEIDSLWIEIA